MDHTVREIQNTYTAVRTHSVAHRLNTYRTHILLENVWSWRSRGLNMAYLFLALIYDMMFWLKNLRMRGMQLANTRCWDTYSNCTGQRATVITLKLIQKMHVLLPVAVQERTSVRHGFNHHKPSKTIMVCKGEAPP